VHEARVERVRVVWRRLDVAGDEDGYDKGVDGQDTRHDNGNERLGQVVSLDQAPSAPASASYLHNQVRPVCTNTSNADTSFGCAIRGSGACSC